MPLQRYMAHLLLEIVLLFLIEAACGTQDREQHPFLRWTRHSPLSVARHDQGVIAHAAAAWCSASSLQRELR